MKTPLEILFGSRLRARLLGWLMTHPDERYFVRQLTGILGADSTNVSRELARLAGLGILTSREEGRQKYFQADPRSPLFPELRGLAVKTAGVVDVLREALAPAAGRVAAAFVFGSVAEGRANNRSDVDVLVVGSVPFEEVSRLLGTAGERLKREVNPTVYPVAEFRAKLAAGHHFLTSVRKGKKVFLFGDERELDRLAQRRLAA
jgi:predicted nucleotidyltransferase